ncbi:amidohydrolase [Luminiphilus syltensis NOR5-1B]|uniref:Amidohydrolase n=1 Tax=Luminiphilus syltensis NOR5-1B TaxID=565045 RepID=B8KXF4_9GAMM|nr:amidohydrolase [Luminiphilus syltensis NOR5-1B]
MSCLLATPASLAESFDRLAFYKYLHRHPELSFQEESTATYLADTWRSAGFEVTESVGGFGVVGVLRNGEGPTVMIRMDTDALPITEQTGLAYASTQRAIEQTGQEVGVMHACGHDIHMTVGTETALNLAGNRDAWRGTLVVIAQPAEERGAGARAMLEDGLFERFPIPDYNLSLHTLATLPAGKIGYVSGWMMANVDSVDIHLKGVGGHGAYPHNARDPVVLAASIIMDLQTLVSREIAPIDPGVVTVGSIHAGTKHNIIPDSATLQLTVRSYSDATRKALLDGIKRIALKNAEAMGFGAELAPEVIMKDEYTPALWNDPKLVAREVEVLKSAIGTGNVIEVSKEMGGEDFARYGRTSHKIPSFMMRVGVVPEALWQQHQTDGTPLPSLHSPFFAPDPEKSIQTGVDAMTAMALDLLTKEPSPN